LSSNATSEASAVSIPSRLSLHATFGARLLKCMLLQNLAVVAGLPPFMVSLNALHPLGFVIFLHILLGVVEEVPRFDLDLHLLLPSHLVIVRAHARVPNFVTELAGRDIEICVGYGGILGLATPERLDSQFGGAALLA
jgi:hypothetical protein